ncbi:hypothetical protein [Vibrio owensii]|uniref:hypothetical protein n=1 Tax=Vibrio owensii TaxID=696485 RepID=UPI0018F10B4C|nr:hypothetical protein [Vibrio owensii]
MKEKYPLKIENVGDNTYMLMSRGHHCIHEFMKQSRKDGYDWPLGTPTHVWFKTVPNNATGGSTYHDVEEGTKGAFPATFCVEAYGDDQYPHMIYWSGKNLQEVIAFTGKCENFDNWFPTWESYVNHVKNENDIFKIIKECGNEIAKPGDWIYRDKNGEHHVLKSSA